MPSTGTTEPSIQPVRYPLAQIVAEARAEQAEPKASGSERMDQAAIDAAFKHLPPLADASNRDR
jgi:hypothetical protein